jgi:hypothetical protein
MQKNQTVKRGAVEKEVWETCARKKTVKRRRRKLKYRNKDKYAEELKCEKK